MRKIYVVIVAAGTGSRFGSSLPKQFCRMAVRPVVMTTIDAFRNALPGCEILLVIDAKMQSLWEELCLNNMFFARPRTIAGGATRAESVRNALAAIDEPDNSDAIVLVHDGARPLVTLPVIERVVGALKRGIDAAIPVVPLSDSIRAVDPADPRKSVAADRSLFRAVQTPQGFPLTTLKNAYRFADIAQFTDDASAIEAAGYGNVVLVDGSVENIKITNPADIAIAEAILAKRK